jgi:hypothetical protein
MTLAASKVRLKEDVAMDLPSGEQAIIDPRKIVGYCLSVDHEDGCHKAHVFASILGLTTDHADRLLEALKEAAATGDATLGMQDQYGQRYQIDFEFTGPIGKATIRSAWIIRSGENAPRLVTCYIL